MYRATLTLCLEEDASSQDVNAHVQLSEIQEAALNVTNTMVLTGPRSVQESMEDVEDSFPV